MRPVVGFVTRGGSVKLRHLRERSRTTVVFRSGWRWVTVEGHAVLAGPDDPLAGLEPADVPRLLGDVFTAIGGTHDDWDEYDRVMAEQRRAAVLRPERVYAGSGWSAATPHGPASRAESRPSPTA